MSIPIQGCTTIVSLIVSLTSSKICTLFFFDQQLLYLSRASSKLYNQKLLYIAILTFFFLESLIHLIKLDYISIFHAISIQIAILSNNPNFLVKTNFQSNIYVLVQSLQFDFLVYFLSLLCTALSYCPH